MPTSLTSSADACKRLFIDRSTLSRWVKAGKITPEAKAPGRTGAFLFDPADIERLVPQ